MTSTASTASTTTAAPTASTTAASTTAASTKAASTKAASTKAAAADSMPPSSPRSPSARKTKADYCAKALEFLGTANCGESRLRFPACLTSPAASPLRRVLTDRPSRCRCCCALADSIRDFVNSASDFNISTSSACEKILEGDPRRFGMASSGDGKLWRLVAKKKAIPPTKEIAVKKTIKKKETANSPSAANESTKGVAATTPASSAALLNAGLAPDVVVAAA
jgi:hypothetical protein